MSINNAVGDLSQSRLKQTLYDVLEDTGQHRAAARRLRHLLVFLIIANIAFAIIETVPAVRDSYGAIFVLLQLASGFVFLVEYVLRIFVADLHPPLRRYGPFWGRLRYAARPDAIVDLISALPLLLVLFLPNSAFTIVVVLRLLRFLKLARYSPALRSLLSALASERQALSGSAVIIGGVIIFAGTLLYLVEHDIQPEKLASIPHAIWWAIATVTTVGYGDVVPVSNLGKMLGGLVMLMGYGLLALPVGIIASAFAREIHSRDFVVTWSMVARVPLFEDLTAAEIAEVSKLLNAQKARAGTVLAAKGEPANKMYFISDGEVQIDLGPKMIFLGEGNFFGELALIHQSKRTVTVTAFHDCELLVLEAQALQQLMDRNPSLGSKILQEAEERAQEGHRVLGDLAEEELAQAEAYAASSTESEAPDLFKGKEPKPQTPET